MTVSRLPLVALVLSAHAIACSGPEDQEISGRVGQGWDSAPVAVNARPITLSMANGGEADLATAPVQQSGAFLLTLPGDQRYTLFVTSRDGSEVPLVFPGDNGTANVALRIYGGAARFDMGPVDRIAPYDSTVVGSSGASDVLSTSQGLTVDPGSDAGVGGSGSGAAVTGSGEEAEEEDAETCGEDDFDEGTALQRDEAAVPTSVPPQGLGVCDDDSSDDDSDDDSEDEDDED